MPVYSWLLCTLLIGQAADGQPLVIPAQAMPGGGINNAPPGHPLAGRGTTNKAARATADQLLAEALTPPAGSRSTTNICRCFPLSPPSPTGRGSVRPFMGIGG